MQVSGGFDYLESANLAFCVFSLGTLPDRLDEFIALLEVRRRNDV